MEFIVKIYKCDTVNKRYFLNSNSSIRMKDDFAWLNSICYTSNGNFEKNDTIKIFPVRVVRIKNYYWFMIKCIKYFTNDHQSARSTHSHNCRPFPCLVGLHFDPPWFFFICDLRIGMWVSDVNVKHHHCIQYRSLRSQHSYQPSNGVKKKLSKYYLQYPA